MTHEPGLLGARACRRRLVLACGVTALLIPMSVWLVMLQGRAPEGGQSPPKAAAAAVPPSPGAGHTRAPPSPPPERRRASAETLLLAARAAAAARAATDDATTRELAYLLRRIALAHADAADPSGAQQTLGLLRAANGDGTQVAEAEVAIAVAHAAAGDVPASQRATDSLDDLAGRRARAYASAGAALFRLGRRGEADAMFARAGEVARRSDDYADRVRGLGHVAERRAAAGMAAEAMDTARAMDELASAAPPAESEAARSLAAEAYSAVAVARNRAGDYRAAEALLDRVLHRDGVLARFAEDRALALDFEGAGRAVARIGDGFARGRASLAAARVCVAMGPAFGDESRALLDVGVGEMNRFERADPRFRTLAADVAACGAATGRDVDLVMGLVADLPPEYRVPGWATAALAASDSGRPRAGGRGNAPSGRGRGRDRAG